MRFVFRGENLQVLAKIDKQFGVLATKRGRKELHHGVIDAGKRTQTKVQRAVAQQMGVAPGRYQSLVVAGTGGNSIEGRLSFEIYGRRPGAKIDNYKGLKSIKAGGRLARTLNRGINPDDHGTVRSSVWNNPRLFKRSFATERGFFAFRKGNISATSSAPKELWTFGSKPGQPRGAGGKFASTGKRYGKVRVLFGPSIRKEIPQGLSLQTFHREGPVLLEKAIKKRLAKLITF